MICITFDTDYMSRAGMARFFDEKMRYMPGKGTFFVHADFPELLTTGHEVCPHPFISDLNRWEQDLIRLESFLPHKSAGIRPHSCVFSHMIGIGLKNRGYNYVSQAQNLYSAKLVPFQHPWGIWELPIYYMDSMDFWMSRNWPNDNHIPFAQEIIDRATAEEGLFVFDFHPLHIALNTRNCEDYISVKNAVVIEGESPFDHTRAGVGVLDFFDRLCSKMEERAIRSYTCSEALQAYGCG